jgi:N-acyl-phosphatidylethanolamine-hydrolysing phospholipase D
MINITRISQILLPATLALSLTMFPTCNSIVVRFTARSIEQSAEPVQAVVHKIEAPIKSDVGLSVLWVGHATVLIQIHDKVIITDPVFTKTVGMFAKRSIEPGLDPSAISRLDAILISHLHFDHFSYGSLDMLPKEATLVVPPGGASYTPDFGFAETCEAVYWQPFELGGLKITPVPVQHFGGRYGFDVLWGPEHPFTGYIIEYNGTTIFFAGDTGYNPEFFKEIGRRFRIDLALLPIAPIEPRDFMQRIHTDPAEAIHIFDDLNATLMIPMHFGTFSQGLESSPTDAQSIMEQLINERGLQSRVRLLKIGEQVVLQER